MDSQIADTIHYQLINSEVYELTHSTEIIQIIQNNQILDLYILLMQKEKWLFNCRYKFCSLIVDLMYRFIIDHDMLCLTHLYELIYDGPDIGLYQIILCRILSVLYDNNQLDLILGNKWLLQPRNYTDGIDVFSDTTTFSFVRHTTNEKFADDIIRFMITNYRHYDIQHIWIHIVSYFRREDITSESIIAIIRLCAETQISQLTDFLYFAYFANRYAKIRTQIFEAVIEFGIMPSPRVIGTVFLRYDAQMLKLFIKHNINIKDILTEYRASDWSQEMACIMSELGLDIYDYFGAVSLINEKN